MTSKVISKVNAKIRIAKSHVCATYTFLNYSSIYCTLEEMLEVYMENTGFTCILDRFDLEMTSRSHERSMQRS
jgi:hypothetical protein